MTGCASVGFAPITIIQFVSFKSSIEFVAAPARHFSGRGFTRNNTLWSSWVLKSENSNIFFSGDSGYGKHFKEIGEKLGPFDFGFMECGQYNEDWRPVHLFPNESVQAAKDAQAKKIMPVHCAGFALSYAHAWKEPIEEFIEALQMAENAEKMLVQH